MSQNITIGKQDFEKIRTENCFYIDKTHFIKEWWERNDDVTLITRPRRFGKTLNMSMVEQFFSVQYKNRGDLFEGLSIWQEEKFRMLQGTYPVISLSFANVKEKTFEATREKICRMVADLYDAYQTFFDFEGLTQNQKNYILETIEQKEKMNDVFASMALHRLSQYLYKHYQRKVIILLDEYDTPMQEAYVNGYWDEIVDFTRNLFHATFKTNSSLERAMMTGITRVSKNSIFSDLNNPMVVTTTSNEYASAFGFTEEEVFEALDAYGLGGKKEKVKWWYDGFVFGQKRDIYNPWSIINFLKTGGLFDIYWANTSNNRLVSKLIREGSKRLKISFEALLKGETIFCPIDEQVVYNQLGRNEGAIWSLLLSSGYLKAISMESKEDKIGGGRPKYELALTNEEVRCMFEYLVHDWFEESDGNYNDFIEAFLRGNLKEMNIYMNRVTLQTFSYFDTGKSPSYEALERFYHGFVLGLIADLGSGYIITSNRESGFGRYDVVIEPKNKEENAMILEFKVHEKDEESSLEDTVRSALAQIEEKQYEVDLIARGFSKEQIRKYGFAFEGKKVLIG